MSWDHENIITLIKSYEKFPILWKKDHKQYYSATVKDNAWRELSVILQKDVDTIKKKLESLRGSHRREKNRILKSIRNGGNVYVSKWFAWDSLKFLDDSEELQGLLHVSSILRLKSQTENTIQDPLASDNEDIVEDKFDTSEYLKNNSDRDKNTLWLEENSTCDASTTVSPSSSSLNKTVSKRKLDEFPHEQEDITVTNRQSNVDRKDECAMFGDYIAEKMRKLNNRSRAILQHSIHNLLFEAEMENINDTLTSKSSTKPIS